jgi:hypothetical protein
MANEESFSSYLILLGLDRDNHTSVRPVFGSNPIAIIQTFSARVYTIV